MGAVAIGAADIVLAMPPRVPECEVAVVRVAGEADAASLLGGQLRVARAGIDDATGPATAPSLHVLCRVGMTGDASAVRGGSLRMPLFPVDRGLETLEIRLVAGLADFRICVLGGRRQRQGTSGEEENGAGQQAAGGPQRTARTILHVDSPLALPCNAGGLNCACTRG